MLVSSGDLNINDESFYGFVYVKVASVMDYLALFPAAAVQEMIRALFLH